MAEQARGNSYEELADTVVTYSKECTRLRAEIERLRSEQPPDLKALYSHIHEVEVERDQYREAIRQNNADIDEEVAKDDPETEWLKHYRIPLEGE